MLKNLLAMVTIFATSSTYATVSNQEISTFYSPISYTGFSLFSADADGSQEGGGGYSTYNFVSVHYRVNPQSKFVLRLPFIYSSAGFDDFNEDVPKSQELLIADVITEYSRTELLVGDIEMYWAIRYYFPTSKTSNQQKKIGVIRNEVILSKSLSKRWEVEYWPKFYWHMQTQSAYENSFEGISNTKRYELNHWMTLWYKPSKDINLGWFIGGEDNWYNNSSTNDTSRQRNGRLAEHLIKTGPSLAFNLGNNFNFIFQISNQVGVSGYSPERTGKTSDLGKFKPSETQFVLLSFMRF